MLNPKSQLQTQAELKTELLRHFPPQCLAQQNISARKN